MMIFLVKNSVHSPRGSIWIFVGLKIKSGRNIKFDCPVIIQCIHCDKLTTGLLISLISISHKFNNCRTNPLVLIPTGLGNALCHRAP